MKLKNEKGSNMVSEGIIMFNRGDKMVVRILVCLYSLRKHYDGPITFYVEEPCSCTEMLIEEIEKFNVNVIRNDSKEEIKVLARKTEMFQHSPYDKTIWLDSDTVITGPINEIFDALSDCDIAIPHFINWWSDGRTIAKRIRSFEGIANKHHISKALEHNPAINTGVLAFNKSDKWSRFVHDWVELANEGFLNKIFISDEVAFQILYPSINEWGLKCKIIDEKFNTSIKFGQNTEDIRILHAHGQKHCLDFELCDIWKQVFHEMLDKNIANIKNFLQYADKRLKKYLSNDQDVTIVTACDEKYVDILRETFPNWRKYKNIDEYPVIVFVHGIPESDSRLDFLKLPNVRIIPWSMDNADSHREEMLSAFVFGTAENVQTDYWLKIDADSYATNDIPFITPEMKKYAFCGHKWSYSKVDHIKQLDEWAKGHWKPKLKNAKPMISEGRIDGTRFFHNTKRTISFIQLHKTKFTKFCVNLLRERKLPAPTQDTFCFYIANRFDPHTVGTMNFKKNFGFAQGNGRKGIEAIRKRLSDVEKQQHVEDREEDDEYTSDKIEVKFESNPIDFGKLQIPSYARIPEILLNYQESPRRDVIPEKVQEEVIIREKPCGI